MKKRGKRAVSPVISTVLLIVIVVILALIIFLWARGFIKEKISKFDKPIESVCSDVNLKISVSPNREISLVNRGNIPVFSINIRKEKPGTSKIENRIINLGAGDSASQFFVVEEEYNKITIIPVLLGKSGEKRKVYTCSEDIGIELEL